MSYDLNIVWETTTSPTDLQRIITFSAELNHTVIALNHILLPPIPTKLSNPIPDYSKLTSPHHLTIPPTLTILRRLTLIISDPSQNHRLSTLTPLYDILALRPTTEKAYLAACVSLSASDFTLISLDLTQRFPFHFRPKQCMAAVKRGLRFEICYGQGMGPEREKRSTFLSNVKALIRATGGRGLVVSSEAKGVLALRGREDVGNLGVVWGLSADQAKEAGTVNPRGVVVNERIRRSGHRGAVDVVDSGAVPMEE